MSQTSLLHKDFDSFAKTVNALNKASRTIQDIRREQVNSVSDDGQQRMSSLKGANPTFNPFTIGTFQDLASAIPSFDTSVFSNGGELAIDGAGGSYGFMRALEHDFVGRNWNEAWWDMEGALPLPEA
jgi:hypothetical protein